jgi:hypothetical protein
MLDARVDRAVLAKGRGAMYCTNCGTAGANSAKFCGRCGCKLPDYAVEQQAPAQVPPAAPPAGPPYQQPPAEYRLGAGLAYPQPPIEYRPDAAPPTPPPAEQASGGSPPPAASAHAQSRRRRPGAIAAAAIIIVLGALAVAGWQTHFPSAVFGSGAPPALTWSVAQAPLPADSVQTSSQNSAINDVACPGVNSCVAVGYYTAGDGSTTTNDGLIETLSNGIWTPAKAPLDVAGSSTVDFVNLAGVSCSSPTACVAVGSYFNRQNVELPLAETLSGTTWSTGVPALPGNADQGKSAFLSEVACPAQGTCVAAGWYTDQNGDAQGLIDTLSDGRWTATQAPLPAGAAARSLSSTTIPTGLFVVRCAAVGYCVAAGDYIDKNGATQGLIDTLSGGTWTATRAPLPGDASAANPAAYMFAVTCQGVGTCLATGHYNSGSGQSRDLIESLSGGTWTPVAAPLPANASATQHWSVTQVTGLTAVACQAAGTCVAEGSYIAGDGGMDGVIDTLSGGTWTAATAALPSGAAVAKQYAFFGSAACPASGTCVAVGGYKTTNGATMGLIDTATAKNG